MIRPRYAAVKSRHGYTPEATLAKYDAKHDDLCSNGRPGFAAATTEGDCLKELYEGASYDYGQ
jgi:hypothetical protein